LTSPPEDERPVSLRARKQQRTRGLIQKHALRLFKQRGYERTTVEMLCAAAEVSPATFYRYFRTKADVVLTDDFDPVIASAFETQPVELSSLAALRSAFNAALGQMTPTQAAEQLQRIRLILEVPELRAAMTDQYGQAIGLIAGLVARRTDKSPHDPQVLTFAGAIIGVLMAVMYEIADRESVDLPSLLDEALEGLESIQNL
jgi:AcrR family transcriptional regulator